MADTRKPPSDDFATRLSAARKAQDGANGPARGQSRQTGLAYRVAIEMAAGLAVGAGLGWMLDRWLGTRPVFLAVMAMMGFAAGVLNVWRAARQLGAATDGEAKDEGENRRG